MIVEIPLVTAAEIAAEYRPGSRVTAKATLRRLRERELVSTGVVEHPRGTMGRVAGAWRLYSALNLDAARAARSDDESTAREIAKIAGRVEQLRNTVELIQKLATLGESVSLRRRFEWASSLDEELSTILRAVVDATLTERKRLVHDRLDEPRLALVAHLYGDIAELTFENAERPLMVPVADLEVLDSAFVGAALALRFESFGPGQTLVKATPAIRLDGGDDSRIYPYERPLPDAHEPISLAGALSEMPTIRRPRRIEISGGR